MPILHKPSLAPLVAAAIVLAACDSPSESEARECGGKVVALAVGQAADLPSGEDCDLGTQAGAEYSLAYVDGRGIALAETGAEPYSPSSVQYSVTVTDLLGGGARSAGASLQASPRAELVVPDWSVSAADGPRAFVGATGGNDGWTLGETITITDPCPGGVATCPQPPTRAARVVRVYPSQLVVAAVESELGATLAPMLAVLDEAMPIVAAHALPLMKSVYTDGVPAVSSAAGGQMLVLLEGDNSGVAARTFGRWEEDGSSTSWISIEPFPGQNAAWAASLVSHELTHAYQLAYMARTRSPGKAVNAMGAAVWGVEGGANLVSYEVIRRAAGKPLAPNADFRTPGGGMLEQFLAYRAQPGDGHLTQGYDAGAGFFRDLVIRRVRGGESENAAVREVSRGAVDGWFGLDPAGSRRTGLTARMRERIGGWEPKDALLTWALSHAGDDLTGNATYQDHAWLRVWASAEQDYGWFPEAVLQGGAGSVTGQTLFGSPGYFLLRDTGAGMSIRLGSSAPGVQWRVLRIR
jgi:hypothetical protein